jgi:hypothetical protein
VIFVWLGSAWAAEEPSAQGYVEARGQYVAGVADDEWQAVERVRPETTVPLHERVAFTATVEAAFVQGRDATELVEADDYLSVERLYLDVWLPFADARIGRQAINWGSAFFVNPTDPFPEVLLTEPWRERAGVNAARVTVPIAERHSFQGVIGIDDGFDNVRAAGRATANVLQTDFSVVGAYRQETDDGLVGLDVRGTAGVGFWVEGAWHLDVDPYEEVAVGIDYSFPLLDGLVVNAQYYRNGSGAVDVLADPLFLLDQAESTDDPFAPVFHGRDYAMAGGSLIVNTAFSGSALFVQNLGDGSAVAVPSLTWTPSGWFELSGSALVPVATWGDGGELHPPDEILGVDISRLVPDAIFTLWTRVSF